MARRRILYVHHGSGTGGAPLSLCSLIRELDRDHYEPILCCHPAETSAIDLFSRWGYEPLPWALTRCVHSAAGWWKPWSLRDVIAGTRWLRSFGPSCRALRRLLDAVQPDLVHLNSLTLLPYAPTARASGAKVVVHVREPAARGLFGFRRAWLRRIAQRDVDAVVAICVDNRDRLTGAHPRTRVIYNFVDFGEFDRNLDRAAARRALGIAPDAPVVLFAGGSSAEIKGIVPMLHALVRLRDRGGPLTCLMPGTIAAAPRPAGRLRRLLRGKVGEQRVVETIAALRLDDVVRRFGFRSDMPAFYAASDVVAVPFIK
ncbi:MAG TPA: glycosyltransferase family 4 protein, partial [Phycisphaerae bacterium]|nr:glycosyltransferase family 4 protein [Phycisphaerae bacterium]